MANINSIKQRSKEIVRGDVLIDWDLAQVVEAEYEYYKAEHAELLKGWDIHDIEDFAIWYLEGEPLGDEHPDLLWDAFEGLFKGHNYYAEFYSVRGWMVNYRFLWIKDARRLWDVLDIEGYEEFKVVRITDQGFPGLEVHWYDCPSGSRGDVIVIAREDSICPVCSVGWYEYEEGDRERAFIRRWGCCPFCVEGAIIEFCQGARTDDTGFLYQPGDYLMWDRLTAIRVDMAGIDFYLNDEATDLLEEVKRPVPGSPGRFMYGR